ncbi:Kelch repeat-containing protein [Ferruginibacter sp.]
MEKKISPIQILVAVSLLFFVSCKKSDDSDDLVGNWKRSSEMEGVGRTDAFSFIINDHFYIGGGTDGNDRLSDVWQFEPSTGTWYRKAAFPGTLRTSAVAFAIGDKAYVATGFDGIRYLGDVWEYNSITDSWRQLKDFDGGIRTSAVAFSIGGKGYICSGYNGNYLKDLWEYDPASDSWTQKASLTGDKRRDAIAFVYNSKAYVITGTNNGSYVDDLWIYDPSTDSWASKRKIISYNDDEEYDDDYGTNITRSNAAVLVMNDRAYLATGSGGNPSTTWQYDFVNDQWSQKTSFEGTLREGAIGFVVGGRGFLTTGASSSQYFDDCWEFFPNAEQDDSDN